MSLRHRGQTRECTIDQLQPTLFQLAKQYIASADRILTCLESKVEQYESGFFGERVFGADFSVGICTQCRVVHLYRSYDFDQKRWQDYAQTMELADIETVQENQDGFVQSFIVQLSGRGSAKLGLSFCSREAASKFASVVRNAVEQAKAMTSRSSSASPSSVEERIRFLKKLRQDGTITEPQFQQKIQEIINQL